MDPRRALVQIARKSAAAWPSLAANAFRGKARIETANTVYCFFDGFLLSRSTKSDGAVSIPPSMRGLRLIGFLADEGGFWSLSSRWRPGALAVLWQPGQGGAPDAKSCILTTATVAYAVDDPEPQPWVADRTAPSASDVFRRPPAQPPTYRRPAPPSATRLVPATRAS
jgi:hypothetical protein